jgi:DNA-binding CsgD family transcriptional regulator
MDNGDLTELIGCIYDSASDPERWSQFLSRLSHISESRSAILVMHNAGQAKHTVSSSWGFEERALRLYETRYGDLDPWTQRGLLLPAGYVCSSEELCPLEELTQTEIYNDFMRPYDVKHAMFGVVTNDIGSMATVSLFRDSKGGEFQMTQLEILRLLVPHVQRASAIHFRLADVNARSASFENAIDMLQFGVILISSANKILHINSSAKRHIDSESGLRFRRGRLVTSKECEQERFTALVSQCVRTARREGIGAGGTMLVSRIAGRPLSVTVAPLRTTGWPEQPAAVVFISDLDERAELPAELLRRCYGLSPAESQLALALIRGHSLKEVAGSLYISLNTAKTQLKSIFTKTQVKRQGELINLLLRSGGLVIP